MIHYFQLNYETTSKFPLAVQATPDVTKASPVVTLAHVDASVQTPIPTPTHGRHDIVVTEPASPKLNGVTITRQNSAPGPTFKRQETMETPPTSSVPSSVFTVSSDAASIFAKNSHSISATKASPAFLAPPPFLQHYAIHPRQQSPYNADTRDGAPPQSQIHQPVTSMSSFSATKVSQEPNTSTPLQQHKTFNESLHEFKENYTDIRTSLNNIFAKKSPQPTFKTLSPPASSNSSPSFIYSSFSSYSSEDGVPDISASYEHDQK